AAISAPLAGLPLALGHPALVGAIAGYSRELETEADVNGLALLAAAGYDLSESTHLFKHLREWIREEKAGEPFFYATHPRLAERRNRCGGSLPQGHRARCRVGGSPPRPRAGAPQVGRSRGGPDGAVQVSRASPRRARSRLRAAVPHPDRKMTHAPDPSALHSR